MEDEYFKNENLWTDPEKLIHEYVKTLDRLFSSEYLDKNIKTKYIRRCQDFIKSINDVSLSNTSPYLQKEFYDFAKKSLIEEIATPNGVETHFYTDNKVLFNKLIVYPEYVCQTRK